MLDGKGRTYEEALAAAPATISVEHLRDGTVITTTLKDGWKHATWTYRGVTCNAHRCPRARDWLGEALLPDQHGGRQGIYRSRSLADTKKAARWIIDEKLPTEDRKGQFSLFEIK